MGRDPQGLSEADRRTIQQLRQEYQIDRRPTPVQSAPPATNVPTDIDVQALSSSLRADIARAGGQLSNPQGVTTALEAARAMLTQNPGAVRQPYMFYVDVGRPNTTPRGYIFNLNTGRVEMGPMAVAHGYGSGAGTPRTFTDVNGHGTTVLGLMIGQGYRPYSGSAKSIGPYTSTMIQWAGVTPNSNTGLARDGKWTHGAPYVSQTSAGNSAGCPAVSFDNIERVVKYVGAGGLGFVYSPYAGNRDMTRVAQYTPPRTMQTTMGENSVLEGRRRRQR
jgi:hypothetical protein